MIAYSCGAWDVLRANELEKLDREIQLGRHEGAEYFGLGIYDDNLCEALGLGKPLKNIDERMEILRHFKFVDGVYKYYVRDLHIASDYIKSKYRENIEAIYLGSDLKKDFSDTDGLNIVFTPRPKETMEKRSTTNYRKLYLGNEENRKYKGKINKNIKKSNKNKGIDER